IRYDPLRKVGPDEVRKMSATPDSTFTNLEQRIADLERQLAECKAERDEALAQQSATADVLGVINLSVGDLAPVFDAILEKAHDFCGADHGSMFLYDGERFRAVATHGLTEAFAATMQQGTLPDSAVGQPLIAGKPFVHIHDTALVEHPNYRDLDVI